MYLLPACAYIEVCNRDKCRFHAGFLKNRTVSKALTLHRLKMKEVPDFIGLVTLPHFAAAGTVQRHHQSSTGGTLGPASLRG